jgi:hypothetical protein
MRKSINALNINTGGNKPSGKTTKSILYVAYLNKPLIALAAMKEDYSSACYDNHRKYTASVYATALTEDRIPVILSAEDEMMLSEDEFSAYY